ncbi:MAG: primosomal protein N' [Cycloclasticus sp.]|nr:MAG: primosomal protein N' [Cycloclasticus sp.]
MQPFYLKIAIDTPVNRLFDYLPIKQTERQSYAPGQRVIAVFGRTQKTGIIVDITNRTELSAKQLKPVKERLDNEPILSSDDIKLLTWAAHYYHQPIGEVFAQALPKKLRSGALPEESFEKLYSLSPAGKDVENSVIQRAPRQAALRQLMTTQTNPNNESLFTELEWDWKTPLKNMIEKGWVSITQSDAEQAADIIPPDFQPNKAQQTAIDAVLKNPKGFNAFLLDGVTGSGKTEVYLQLINHALSLGKQVMVLLPEINLTPQLAQRFRQRLATTMAIYHSSLSDTQRAQSWIKCRSGSAHILLGTRSSVFTPMKNLGLIILDEEHDTSFKQQEGFRYSARDVAVMRARNMDIPIVMGSATPSLESLYNVQQSRFHRLSLPERTGQAKAPTFRIIDCRNQTLNNQLSPALIKAIDVCIARDEQIILFVNRRGFAPVLMCHGCGWIAQCKRCDSKLVIHQKLRQLKCHHCGAEHQQPTHCPSCQQAELFPLGSGTQRIEDALRTMYPNVPISRIDRDSTRRKDAMQTVIDKVHEGGAQILVGTQMLAKGHHFPNVTLVGIVDMDAGLFSIDYRSSERMAQLLIQVAGRAGRENKAGKVLIQTYHPEHPLLQTLIQQDYATFAKDALDERQQAGLPPYHHQALLRVNAVDESAIMRFLNDVKSAHTHINNPRVSLLGPVPSPMLKRAGRLRYQVLFQTSERKSRHQYLQHLTHHIGSMKSARKVRWSIDVDPTDLY